MSEIVELAFRQELVGAFSPELGERVYDNAHPPEAVRPLAMYRRIGAGTRRAVFGGVDNWREARIQLTLKGESYSELKRLQDRIERHFETFSGRLGRAIEGCCPVTAHSVQVVTMPDFREPNSRERLAISDFIVRYSG